MTRGTGCGDKGEILGQVLPVGVRDDQPGIVAWRLPSGAVSEKGKQSLLGLLTGRAGCVEAGAQS